MELNILSNQELFTLRIEVEKEMSGRGMKFDVGAMGEQLAIAYFNSTPGLPNLIDAPTGAKNIDALSRDGERYSIKTQLKAKKTGTVYPDEKQPKKQLFEQLLVVQLSTDITEQHSEATLDGTELNINAATLSIAVMTCEPENTVIDKISDYLPKI